MRSFLVLSSLLVACASKELPSFIEKCKVTDDVEVGECIKDRMNSLRARLEKGIPELKLPPIEPLHVSKMEIHTGTGSSVAFDAVVSDAKIYGVKEVTIKEFELDLKKKRAYIHLEIPSLYITAVYEIKGKVLLFELQSKGPMNMNITDVDGSTKFDLDIIEKNGKRYIDIKTTNIEASNKFSKATIYFDKLFGNKNINDEVNNAINENIQELTKEVGPLVHEAIHLLVASLINPVFREYAIEDLFIIE